MHDSKNLLNNIIIIIYLSKMQIRKYAKIQNIAGKVHHA